MNVAPYRKDIVQLGKLKLISGERKGKFPYCNTLFIADSAKVIIDPGAGLHRLSEVKENTPVDLVFNSHYHFDHIAYNYLFGSAQIYLHESEKECFVNREEIAYRTGFTEVFGEEWVKGWMERTSRPDTIQSPYSPQNRYEWSLSTARVDGTYHWGQVFDFGSIKMEVIGTPGHTGGYSSFYFPELGVVYAGDVDITAFGPWYGGPDSDIDLFISSARKLARLDAQIYITSHERGVVSGRVFRQSLEPYLDVINVREEKIRQALSLPLTLQQLVGLGLMYGRKYLVDDWVRAWEELMLKKHLERMLKHGIIACEEGKWVRA